MGLSLATLGACGKPQVSPPDAAPPAPAVASPQKIEEALAAIVATCSKLRGTVEIRRKGEAYWEKATLGATLRQGDWVRTGPKSTVRLQLLGQGHLDLDAETTVFIDADAGEGPKKGVLVKLEHGSARGATPAVAGGATPLVIQSADGAQAQLTAEAGEKPVAFRLTGRSTGQTELAVLEGSARVASAGGEVILRDGTAVDLDAKKPATVVQLIAFPRSTRPGADARFQFAQGANIKLEWAAVKGATGYVVEIAHDLSFEEVVVSSAVGGTRYAFAPGNEGMYAWRVAAKDKDGRLSEFGFVRRLFYEREIPRDLLLAPRDGTRLAYGEARPQVTFSWQPVGDVRSYRLVVGVGSDPTADPVLDQVTPAQRVVVDSLADGIYTWGVYAIRGEVESPIFLTPRSLAIRKQDAPRARTDGLWREESK